MAGTSVSHAQRTPVSFPKYGLPASRSSTLLWRLLGTVSPYHKGKAAIQSRPLVVAQALRRCVLTRDRRLLFLKNPKAACSTVLQLLHHREHGRFADVSHLHRTQDIQQGIRHAEALIAALDDPECVRFTVVREPASRAVSAFMMFFSGAGAEVFKKEGRDKKAAKREAGMWALGYDPNGDVQRNFDVFLEYLAHCFSEGPEHVNVHWKPQTLSIAHGQIDYAHIGRMETLKQDLDTVSSMVGYSLLDGMSELPNVNRARSERAKSFELTAAQRRKIADLYAGDYEVFGY
jgi:hypothetical protein